MSITNTIVGNCDSGAGSVWIVKLPGQSHISSGIIVNGLDYFGGGFNVERILWRKVLEQNFLDRCLPALPQPREEDLRPDDLRDGSS